ncbi:MULTISPECIES: DUF6002 family protein [unclassified Streptomyces]|uniref:DUF6002 family protein n=1 Tax=unclassified Streptomyces TaxID=2593676 RepID=UPI002E12345D|nr:MULTISPECIES: DUF6002 family protein [unclassified Streptomyces]WSR22526.1 DUF6002 family protein [Streptomyces sp. NBC_01205]
MLLENALVHYYEEVRAALRDLLGNPGDTAADEFTPGVELPELTPQMRDYLSVSAVAHSPLPAYRGKSLALLDLTKNPATMTTKTFASLVIVARAVRFIQDTGQRVTIVTPSSANKASAMRDAVLRAIESGLVRADQLNVVVIVPEGSVGKLRGSELHTDPELRARNPIAVYSGDNPGTVKTIARGFVDQYGRQLEVDRKTNVWYTLQLENYLAADVVRALAESEFFPAAADEPRLHVHAVSSAYGLLGHAYGRTTLPAEVRDRTPASQYFLVQHLGAPDMVLSVYNDGSTDPRHLPSYAYQDDTGLFTQDENPRFPAVTFDPRETLDPTFYTRNPPTSERMNELIHGQGGGGIVVSLAECLARYGQARAFLAEAGIRLPANPTAVREWSLVMAVVGILNAIDRGLVPQNDILVHGSGSYAAGDFASMTVRDAHRVQDVEAMRQLVLDATDL